MKISRLLEQHFSETHSGGLTHNLGDSYLCRNNKIFGIIRTQALAYGYSFTRDQSDAYQALPLSQLATILSTKKIPFLDNVSVLEQVENKIPGVAVWDDVSDNLRKNFLFHESCHAVAREMARDFKTEDILLNMLMEEAFANTCELMAVVDADEVVHRIFYEWNSYTALFEAKTNLKNAQPEIGALILMKIIFFGYLHSNFLFNGIDENQLNRIVKLVTTEVLPPKQLKTVTALIKICFTLDPRFKEVTTRFYLRLNGIGVDHRKLANFSYFESFESNAGYRNYVDKLISVVAAK